MGRFKGMSGVKTNQGGLYFKPGNYVVELEQVKSVEARAGYDTFIIQAKILESSNEELVPGCSPSQVIPCKPDIIETAFSNIKAFAAAVLGVKNPDAYVPEDGQDPDEFWDETLEYFVDENEQPLMGTIMRLNCTNITTKAGKPFTKHVWGEVISEAPAKAEA